MTDRKVDIPENDRPKLHHLLGTAALVFAAAILFFALIDRGMQLPFMPSTWYAHRAMWYFLGVVSFVGGVLLLKNPVAMKDDSHTSGESSEVRFRSVTFYTRKDCPLCDEAKEVLSGFRQYLPPVDERDIDVDPELAKQYGDCVPVVVVDDKIRFRGRVSETLLRRLIDGAEPQSAGSPA